MNLTDPVKMIQVRYTNWRGESRDREIIPQENGLWFGSTEWHPEPQWMMKVFDVHKKEWLDFALKDMMVISQRGSEEQAVCLPSQPSPKAGS